MERLKYNCWLKRTGSILIPGETWGLYFSDYEDELRALIEVDTERFIMKHPEDKWRPRSKDVRILECPLSVKRATPPPPLPPPRVLSVLRPPLEADTMPELILASVGVLPCFDMRDYDNPNKYRWRSPFILLYVYISQESSQGEFEQEPDSQRL